MKIVKVVAKDWSHYSDVVDITYKFKLALANVVGFVIHEDEEQLVLSHQLFPGESTVDEVRYTTVIPKEVIKEIEVLRDDAEDEEELKSEQLEMKKEIKTFLESDVGRNIIRQGGRGR